MRVPIFTDAECWDESNLTSSNKLQVWALLRKYSQKINLPLDFSVDSTESLGKKNKPSRKEGSFSLLLQKRAHSLPSGTLIYNRINARIVADPLSLSALAVSLQTKALKCLVVIPSWSNYGPSVCSE